MFPSDRNRKIFKNLTSIAAANPYVASCRLAAAITYKNRVVSYGVNSYKTSPFQKRFASNEDRIHLHAEISAIKNALRVMNVDDLKHTVLYVCRVKRSGHWGMSKPCEGCQRAILEFGIKKIFYTTDDNDIIMTMI